MEGETICRMVSGRNISGRHAYVSSSVVLILYLYSSLLCIHDKLFQLKYL